jgi:hypothetical protein
MKTTLKENETGHILYTKEKDGTQEVTDRFVIPTSIPKNNIKAIDVTALEEDERENIGKLHAEYQTYCKLKMKTIYSFENWLEASHPDIDIPEIKHRNFKIDNIQLV